MFQIHKHKAGMKPLTLCLETDLLSTFFFFFTSRGEGYWTFSNLNRLFKTELTLSILMNLKPQLLRPTGLNLLPSFIILNIECCSIVASPHDLKKKIRIEPDYVVHRTDQSSSRLTNNAAIH